MQIRQLIFQSEIEFSFTAVLGTFQLNSIPFHSLNHKSLGWAEEHKQRNLYIN